MEAVLVVTGMIYAALVVVLLVALASVFCSGATPEEPIRKAQQESMEQINETVDYYVRLHRYIADRVDGLQD